MSKCLTCIHFDFSFWTDITYGDISVEFIVECERRHFNHSTEEGMDEVELHNLLVCGDTCQDYKKSSKICTGCGKRGHENNIWCPHCQKPF